MRRNLRCASSLFFQVSTNEKLWHFIYHTILPSIYGEFTVRGETVKTKEGFVADGIGYLVGQPRLRLLRLKNGMIFALTVGDLDLSLLH
jgi:hypothetical protein